jgi:type IV secretory pathway ATPase VirB11/archaellum biosynthesis ATPase
MVDRKEIMNLINVLKRDSGLQFSESEPVLETDMKGHDARATVIGYPMSPNGEAVSIRKHSTRPWTLTRLIANGTLDHETAGLLSFLVDNRCTFLVCGARGAGKSSLLTALMFEFPVSQRILTIEDTMELPSGVSE